MLRLHAPGRRAALACAALAMLIEGGCSAAGALVGLASAGTDNSMTWDVVKYVHAQITEGDPRPCMMLNSVQRALSARCGAFVAGSIVAADVGRTGLAECPLVLAVRDPQLWPVIGELLDKGARLETCTQAPLVALAERLPCPAFTTASAESIDALRRIALVDPRSVHHDVMRMLSCQSAREAGLDGVLATWRARGALKPGAIGFSPLGALAPEYLATSTLTRDLEADGHTAQAALGGYEGTLAPGFEEALRTSQWAALDWWLQRIPALANRVPPTQGNRLSWLPLARVLVPSFLAHPETQADMVAFLLDRGADPRQRLPSNADQSVLAFARLVKSPMVALLERPAMVSASAPGRTAIAASVGATVIAPASATQLAARPATTP